MHNPEADEIDPQDLEAAAELYDRLVITPPLVEIKINYLAAKKLQFQEAEDLHFALGLQYGYMPIEQALSQPFNKKIAEVYAAMVKALEAYHDAHPPTA